MDLIELQVSMWKSIFSKVSDLADGKSLRIAMNLLDSWILHYDKIV